LVFCNNHGMHIVVGVMCMQRDDGHREVGLEMVQRLFLMRREFHVHPGESRALK